LNNLETYNLTPFEKQLVACSSGDKIEKVSLDEISNMLKHFFLILGIRDYPNKLEMEVLKESIKSLFAKYTIAEIENAFDLALRNVITFDMKLYGNVFNVVFLTDLMKCYEEYRLSVMFKYRAEQARLKEMQSEPTPEEKEKRNYEYVKKGCLDLFEKCKTTTVLVRDADLSIKGIRYEFLKALNLFKYKQSQIDEFRIKAKKIIENEKLTKTKRQLLEAINGSVAEKEKIVSYLKNIILLDYFNTLILNKIELNDEINKAEEKIN